MAQFKLKALTRREAAAIRAESYLRLQSQFVITLLLDVGLRVSEIQGLAPDAFNANVGTLQVGSRILPLPKETTEFLTLYWFRFRGISARKIQRIVGGIGMTAIKCHLTPTTLRHTFALESLTSGMSVETLSWIMGLKPATTQLYIRLYRSTPTEAGRDSNFDDRIRREIAAIEHAGTPRFMWAIGWRTTNCYRLCYITFHNNTGYDVRVFLAGVDIVESVLPSGEMETVSLRPGRYQIAARAAIPNGPSCFDVMKCETGNWCQMSLEGATRRTTGEYVTTEL